MAITTSDVPTAAHGHVADQHERGTREAAADPTIPGARHAAPRGERADRGGVRRGGGLASAAATRSRVPRSIDGRGREHDHREQRELQRGRSGHAQPRAHERAEHGEHPNCSATPAPRSRAPVATAPCHARHTHQARLIAIAVLGSRWATYTSTGTVRMDPPPPSRPRSSDERGEQQGEHEHRDGSRARLAARTRSS
jgi:hypothetical protein